MLCYRMQDSCLQVRSDQKVEYFALSASSSTTTSRLLPAADRAETKLRRPRSRPNVNDRIVVVCVEYVRREGTRTTTCNSCTPGHTCISWSYVDRPLAPALPSRAIGSAEVERERDRASRLRAHQQAGEQVEHQCAPPATPPPPAVPRPHTPPARPSHHPTHLTHTYPTMAPVTFWAAPRQYINWAARHKPAILWSLVIGSFGPLIVVC